MKHTKQRCIILVVTVFVAIWQISCSSRTQDRHNAGTADPAVGGTNQSVTDDLSVEQIIPDGWEPLMDGKTLDGWEIVRYGGEGEPYVSKGSLFLPMAVNGLMTGVCWAGDPFPVNNYVIYYEARRMEGNDIFAGLSFPYGDTFATLVVGGWGGSVCGLSSIDGDDASENETTNLIYFKDKQWYPVQLRVTTDSIRAVIDTIQVVNIATAGKRIHLRNGTSVSGLTLSSYLTTGEIRNLRIKRLP